MRAQHQTESTQRIKVNTTNWNWLYFTQSTTESTRKPYRGNPSGSPLDSKHLTRWWQVELSKWGDGGRVCEMSPRGCSGMYACINGPSCGRRSGGTRRPVELGRSPLMPREPWRLAPPKRRPVRVSWMSRWGRRPGAAPPRSALSAPEPAPGAEGAQACAYLRAPAAAPAAFPGTGRLWAAAATQPGRAPRPGPPSAPSSTPWPLALATGADAHRNRNRSAGGLLRPNRGLRRRRRARDKCAGCVRLRLGGAGRTAAPARSPGAVSGTPPPSCVCKLETPRPPARPTTTCEFYRRHSPPAPHPPQAASSVSSGPQWTQSSSFYPCPSQPKVIMLKRRSNHLFPQLKPFQKVFFMLRTMIRLLSMTLMPCMIWSYQCCV